MTFVAKYLGGSTQKKRKCSDDENEKRKYTDVARIHAKKAQVHDLRFFPWESLHNASRKGAASTE